MKAGHGIINACKYVYEHHSPANVPGNLTTTKRNPGWYRNDQNAHRRWMFFTIKFHWKVDIGAWDRKDSQSRISSWLEVQELAFRAAMRSPTASHASVPFVNRRSLYIRSPFRNTFSGVLTQRAVSPTPISSLTHKGLCSVYSFSVRSTHDFAISVTLWATKPWNTSNGSHAPYDAFYTSLRAERTVIWGSASDENSHIISTTSKQVTKRFQRIGLVNELFPLTCKRL